MKVQVNVFDETVQFSANQPVTGHHIVQYVAKKIGLKPTTGEYFSLQAFKESEQKFVWINLNKKLPALLKSGFKFDSNLNLFFRAKLFPFNFVELKDDPVAIRLFYQQLKTNLHPKQDLSKSLDTFVCALFQQIEVGNCNNFITTQEHRLLFQALKSQIFPDNNFENFETMLNVWNMLEDMTAADAMLNYLTIVQQSAIQYESVAYPMQDKTNSIVININFDNIIIQDKKPNQTTERSVLGWHIIRKVSFEKNNLMLQLLDDKLTKLKFTASTKWAAKDIYTVIVRYHKLHCKYKSMQSSDTTQLLISNQNKFLQNIFQSLTTKMLSKSSPGTSVEASEIEISPPTTISGTNDSSNQVANSSEFLQTLIQKCNGLNQIGELHSNELKEIKRNVQELVYYLSLIYDSNNSNNSSNGDGSHGNVPLPNSSDLSQPIIDNSTPVIEQTKFIINGKGDEISREEQPSRLQQQQQQQQIQQEQETNKGLDNDDSELASEPPALENRDSDYDDFDGSSNFDSADLEEIERICKEEFMQTEFETVKLEVSHSKLQSNVVETNEKLVEVEVQDSMRIAANLANPIEEDNLDINADCIKPVPVVFRRRSERIAQQRIEFFENLP